MAAVRVFLCVRRLWVVSMVKDRKCSMTCMCYPVGSDPLEMGLSGFEATLRHLDNSEAGKRDTRFRGAFFLIPYNAPLKS